VRAAPDPSGPLGTRLLLLVSVLIWGSTFVAMKIALKEVTPLELVALRFAIGLPVLAVVLRAKRIPFGFDRRDRAPLLLGAAILLVHFLVQPFALSLEGSTATNTGWIISFSPLGIALLSRVVLGERLSAGQVFGIALATLGVLLLVSKGDLGNLAWLESRGDWLILGTAFTWALYTIATRDLSRRRSPLAVTFVVFLPLCLVALAAVAARSDLSRFAHLSPSVLASIVFLGVLGTLAQWFWQLGVGKLGAARAGVYLYLEPLATTALAVPLLGERLGLPAAVGAALLLFGVWQAEKSSARPVPEPAG
jgi:drug/metabolite transporter (DMT)-like permease